jgi:hypothetical protein
MIQFDNITFDFGKAAMGEKVRHTFTLTNTGDLPLEITNVHPGCHCTTAGDWTHRVEPGQTGTISVQFDTAGLNANVTRTVDVFSNAKNQPRLTLFIRGAIWRPVEISPMTAVIPIPPDSTNSQSTTVRIVNQTDNPITLSEPTSPSHCFTAVLKEVKPGKEFELAITAAPPFTVGNTPGTFSMKTSLTNAPVISVTAIASVQAAIQIYPSQFIVDASPDRWFTNRVAIHGATTNALVLSNAVASDSRIQLRLEPVGLKGMYNLMAAFPPGFDTGPSRRAEVTVQSNHPLHPVIKIPILQISRPKPAAMLASRGPNPPNAQPITNYVPNRLPAPPKPAPGTNYLSTGLPTPPNPGTVTNHP